MRVSELVAVQDKYKAVVSWTSKNPGGQGIDYFVVKLGNEMKNVSNVASETRFVNVSLAPVYGVSVQAFSQVGKSVETIVRMRLRIPEQERNSIPYAVMAAFGLLVLCVVLMVAKRAHQLMAAVADADKAAADASDFEMALLKDLDDVNMLLDYENMIVSDVFLGHGHFGVVRKGVLKTDGGECPVAVKSLRDRPSGNDLKEFLDEILLMQKVGKHPNIVSMIGYCLDANKRCMLVVEYCPLGDLQTYLRKVRIITCAKFPPP